MMASIFSMSAEVHAFYASWLNSSAKSTQVLGLTKSVGKVAFVVVFDANVLYPIALCDGSLARWHSFSQRHLPSWRLWTR
jgi:hypothetical protein